MLSTFEKFRMVDKNGKNDFEIAVNWKADDPLSSGCKVFKVTFPDGKEAFIDKKHLVEMLFACGSAEEQKEMIPQTLTKMRWYETVLEVKATKDIRKGEAITFPIKLSLPAEKSEVVGPIQRRKSGLLGG